jgi:hypothetical protein
MLLDATTDQLAMAAAFARTLIGEVTIVTSVLSITTLPKQIAPLTAIQLCNVMDMVHVNWTQQEYQQAAAHAKLVGGVQPVINACQIIFLPAPVRTSVPTPRALAMENAAVKDHATVRSAGEVQIVLSVRQITIQPAHVIHFVAWPPHVVVPENVLKRDNVCASKVSQVSAVESQKLLPRTKSLRPQNQKLHRQPKQVLPQ